MEGGQPPQSRRVAPVPGPSMEPSDNASGHPRDASRGPAGCCCCVAWDWLHFHPIRSAPTPPPPLPRLPSSPQGRGDGRETLLILIWVLWRDLPLCWFNGQIKIKNKVPCHQNSLSLSLLLLHAPRGRPPPAGVGLTSEKTRQNSCRAAQKNDEWMDAAHHHHHHHHPLCLPLFASTHTPWCFSLSLRIASPLASRSQPKK